MVMLVRLQQSENAYAPTYVTRLGIVMLVSLPQPENAYAPILVTAFEIRTVRIAELLPCHGAFVEFVQSVIAPVPVMVSVPDDVSSV